LAFAIQLVFILGHCFCLARLVCVLPYKTNALACVSGLIWAASRAMTFLTDNSIGSLPLPSSQTSQAIIVLGNMALTVSAFIQQNFFGEANTVAMMCGIEMLAIIGILAAQCFWPLSFRWLAVSLLSQGIWLLGSTFFSRHKSIRFRALVWQGGVSFTSGFNYIFEKFI
jgi:hypothetical protein